MRLVGRSTGGAGGAGLNRIIHFDYDDGSEEEWPLLVGECHWQTPADKKLVHFEIRPELPEHQAILDAVPAGVIAVGPGGGTPCRCGGSLRFEYHEDGSGASFRHYNAAGEREAAHMTLSDGSDGGIR